MVCPSCQHVYAIKDGIPNMVSLTASCQTVLSLKRPYCHFTAARRTRDSPVTFSIQHSNYMPTLGVE
jgi:hypothetical protein